jgi:hypothetical protein
MMTMTIWMGLLVAVLGFEDDKDDDEDDTTIYMRMLTTRW